MVVRSLLALILLLTLAACSANQGHESTVDKALAELEAWRAEQSEMECPDVEQDEDALNLVRSAQEQGDVRNVYGEDDPYDRVTVTLKHLWSRPNPNGDGVIVTAVRDGDRVGLNEATRARHRAVWLVLDGTVYPLNTNASGAHGVLSSGLPPQIARKAGLPDLAIDTERDLGIEEYSRFRWHGSENPLPDCD